MIYVDHALELPSEYLSSLFLLVLLSLEALLRQRTMWVLPALCIYATIGAWYFIEPLTSDGFVYFNESDVSTAFSCVFIFLCSFRVVVPSIALTLMPRRLTDDRLNSTVPPEKLLIYVVSLWGILLAIGVYRMDGDLVGALYPISGRAGDSMWLRAAAGDAGSTGFLVSTLTYIYTLAIASFGMLLPILRQLEARVVTLVLILVSWPYAFLQGNRNVALATVVPGIFSFLIFGRASLKVKGVFCVLTFFCLDYLFRLIIALRNVGFSEAFSVDVTNVKHEGLNMASELVHIVGFLNNGTLSLNFGVGYLQQLANVIPRAVWPGKPLVGIDYAIARGFGGAPSDVGVFATVSEGVIGQGVREFGIFIGPVVAATLMALWAGILGRLRLQGTVMRSCLFLLGLGLTFNLGRDITLLVLWPFAFGYAAVIASEWTVAHRTGFNRSAQGRKVRSQAE